MRYVKRSARATYRAASCSISCLVGLRGGPGAKGSGVHPPSTIFIGLPSIAPPTPHSGLRATVCAPIPCPSHSWVSAPSPSCRKWPSNPARHIESIAGRSPAGASPPRRAQSQSRSPARCEGPTGLGHTRAWSTQRSRQQHARDGRVGRAPLLDHLVRPLQQGVRNRKPERLGGLEVDHQLKSRGLLNGKLRRLRSPQDLVDEIRRPTVHFGKVWPTSGRRGASGW